MDWTEIVQQLIDLVTSTAPELWRIAYQQVAAQIGTNALWATLSLAGCGTLVSGALRIFKSYDFDEDETAIAVVMCAVAIILFIVFVALLNAVIVRIVSPDYYALRILIGIVK